MISYVLWGIYFKLPDRPFAWVRRLLCIHNIRAYYYYNYYVHTWRLQRFHRRYKLQLLAPGHGTRCVYFFNIYFILLHILEFQQINFWRKLRTNSIWTIICHIFMQNFSYSAYLQLLSDEKSQLDMPISHLVNDTNSQKVQGQHNETCVQTPDHMLRLYFISNCFLVFSFFFLKASCMNTFVSILLL